MSAQFTYLNHVLVFESADTISIRRGGELVDWVSLPGQGYFHVAMEAMRIVREEHEGERPEPEPDWEALWDSKVAHDERRFWESYLAEHDEGVL
jgi:hypothetical protein